MIRGSGGWSLMGWIISFTFLSTVAVLLRFWSARIQKRKFYIDDGFVVVSYVAMLAQQGIGIWAVINGMGNPSTDLTLVELTNQAKVLVAVSTTWIISTTAIKLAMLWLYMRIFVTLTFKRWAIFLMVLDVSFGVTFLIVFLLHCNPVSQEWDPVPWGWCKSLLPSELTSISLNLVLDTAIVILPMPWLYRLRVATSNKIVVMVMFSFGFATIAIMCYRISITVNSDPDPMLATAHIGLLSDMELWLGIIVACLPTMAPFVRAYVQPGFSRLSRRLYGKSGASTEEVTPRAVPKALGHSDTSASLERAQYTDLSESFTYPAQYFEDVRLVGQRTSNFRAEVERGERTEMPDREGVVYVQKQFQASHV